MPTTRRLRIQTLIEKIPGLTNGQFYWLERALRVFENPFDFNILCRNLLDERTLLDFGEALRIHHGFSAEPFTKDKFEFVLEKVLNLSGHTASLAPRGNRGFDILIDGITVSLKTQADAGIREDRIWISKFMELGKGKWGDDPKDLQGLLGSYLAHLQGYQRILILRALEKGPRWRYELVEIPKDLLLAAKSGTLEMKLDSKQFPKPGYCFVRSAAGEDLFQLYFDAGGERKLQIKSLRKDLCTVHATWSFLIPPE